MFYSKNLYFLWAYVLSWFLHETETEKQMGGSSLFHRLINCFLHPCFASKCKRDSALAVSVVNCMDQTGSEASLFIIIDLVLVPLCLLSLLMIVLGLNVFWLLMVLMYFGWEVLLFHLCFNYTARIMVSFTYSLVRYNRKFQSYYSTFIFIKASCATV